MLEEVVMMGRYPHFNYQSGKKDETICKEVIEKMQLIAFRERNYLTLSGGEKQRYSLPVCWCRYGKSLWMAAAIFSWMNRLPAWTSTTSRSFLQTAKAFACEHTVLVAVVHDINLVLQYADNLFFLKDGELAATGKPKEIITERLIKEVFGVSTAIIDNPVTGDPLVVYR
jgi:iron complex transport system ATP-binding protein